jgi:hypothetical protein
MGLRKIVQVEGEGFISSTSGNVSLGVKKLALSAYCKIIHVAGDKEILQINVESTSDEFKKTEMFFFKPSIEENAPNFIKQGYLHLKTLPEFADAIDY